MKKITFFLAAVAMIVASCAKDEPKQQARQTFTITASMPANEPNIDATAGIGTRMAFEAAGKGIITKWTADDMLYAYFIQGANSFRAQAPIVASSITPSGKRADFTITLPTDPGFNSAQPFTLHCYYGKELSFTDNAIGFQRAGITNYFSYLSGENAIRPFMSYKHATPLNAADLSALNIAMQHEGFVVALHIRNSSASTQNVPAMVSLRSADNSNWVGPSGLLSGDENYWYPKSGTWKFPVTKNTDLSFRIKKYAANEADLEVINLSAGGTYTVYAWAMGSEDAPPMHLMFGKTHNDFSLVTAVTLSAKTGLLKKGSCVHVYVTWDGTNVAFGH